MFWVRQCEIYCLQACYGSTLLLVSMSKFIVGWFQISTTLSCQCRKKIVLTILDVNQYLWSHFCGVFIYRMNQADQANKAKTNRLLANPGAAMVACRKANQWQRALSVWTARQGVSWQWYASNSNWPCYRSRYLIVLVSKLGQPKIAAGHAFVQRNSRGNWDLRCLDFPAFPVSILNQSSFSVRRLKDGKMLKVAANLHLLHWFWSSYFITSRTENTVYQMQTYINHSVKKGWTTYIYIYANAVHRGTNHCSISVACGYFYPIFVWPRDTCTAICGVEHPVTKVWPIPVYVVVCSAPVCLRCQQAKAAFLSHPTAITWTAAVSAAESGCQWLCLALRLMSRWKWFPAN